MHRTGRSVSRSCGCNSAPCGYRLSSAACTRRPAAASLGIFVSFATVHQSGSTAPADRASSPGHRPDDATFRAHHARAERRHRGVIRPRRGVDHGLGNQRRQAASAGARPARRSVMHRHRLSCCSGGHYCARFCSGWRLSLLVRHSDGRSKLGLPFHAMKSNVAPYNNFGGVKAVTIVVIGGRAEMEATRAGRPSL
jgi:hypothetical protein